MTEIITRQPQGIPSGGQFAPTIHSEPDLALSAPVPAWPAETQRSRRGHDFYPSATVMAAWPALYATDNGGPIGDKPIQAHYFQGGMDWYVAEYDPKENEAFGYVDLGAGGGEWGYIPLGDVEELRGQFGLPIERDLDFKPGTPAKDCIAKYKAEATAEEAAPEERNEDDGALWDGPDEPSPLSPEDQKEWSRHHKFGYDYGISVLGVNGFEDRDTVERFAGFAANAYMDSGWNGMMDIHGVVDDWMQQERPHG